MKVNLIFFFAIEYETKSFVHVLFYPETIKNQEEDVSRSLRIAWIRPDPIGSDRKPQI